MSKKKVDAASHGGAGGKFSESSLDARSKYLILEPHLSRSYHANLGFNHISDSELKKIILKGVLQII